MRKLGVLVVVVAGLVAGLAGAGWAVRYIDNHDGTVSDMKTGLMWQQRYDDELGFTWYDAGTYCVRLGLAGGGWHLPSIDELKSLVEKTYDYHHGCINPIFGYLSGYYWSSSSHAGYPYAALSVDFDCGGVVSLDKTYWNGKARCVRKGPNEPYVPPTIGQTPISAPPGTAFTQWGTNFNPDSTVTLYSRNPYGWSLLRHQVQADSAGGFEITTTVPWDAPEQYAGTYTWWSVDDATLEKSNVISYEVTSPDASDLSGKVYNARSGKSVSGATVKVGSLSAVNDAAGFYSISSIPTGPYTAAVSRTGYASLKEPLAIPGGNSIRHDFYITPKGELTITGVSSRFSGHPYFLNGFDLNVSFTASVDWADMEPGWVRFTTPAGSYDVPTSTDSASGELNMGAEFGSCGKLKVKAVAADGTESPEVTAEASIVSNPFSPFVDLSSFVDRGDAFSYRPEETKGGFNTAFFKEGVAAGIIPKDIPLFGEKAFILEFVPKLTAELDSSGKAKLAFDWGDSEIGKIIDNEYGRKHDLKKTTALLEGFIRTGRVDRRRFPKASMAGFEVSLYPYVSANGNFSEADCSWRWGGGFKIAGSVEAKQTWPFICMAGPVPVPMFVKASVSASADAGGNLLQLAPLAFQGGIGLNPAVKGSLGAGLDKIFSIEGWLGGGAEWELLLNGTSKSSDLGIYLNGGVNVYAFLFKWEQEMLTWEWHQSGAGGAAALSLPEMGPVEPKLVSRDYLESASHAAFPAGAGAREKTVTANGLVSKTTSAAIEMSVFPYSEPSISAGGTKLNLAWLQDNPARSSINRTMAVSSLFDGTAWSEPAPIKDDGTADFHPDITAFPTGAACAAFEDEKVALPDTGTFEDMLKNLEITVARYSPKTKVWGAAKRLTNNTVLDRSPMISGAGPERLLVTWIANAANDVRGSAAKPNVLKYALFQDGKWSASKTAGRIPHGLLKYDLLFDDATGVVVMSLDSADDPASVAGRELYRMVYSGGTWGALERLTTDGVADENPKLTRTPDGGTLLTWLKEGAIRSVKNFDFTSPVAAVKDEYSSNLADFEVSSSPSGRIALTWIEPSDYASDIYATFFDPVFNVWGSARKLTDDAETERTLAPAFFGDRTFAVVYDRTAVSLVEKTQVTLTGKEVTVSVPTPVSTDLTMVQYKTGGDLSLDPETFVTTPLNPHPGQPLTLQATVVNNGELGAGGFDVVFYSGDPAKGAPEIGRKTVSDTLNPGGSTVVELAWTLPDPPPATAFAVVDPERKVEDRNRANNKARTVLSQPDLALRSLTWKMETDVFTSITARITNLGALPAGATTVRFRKGSATGEIISTQAVPALEPFESFDVLVRIKPADYPAGDIVIYAVVDEGKRIAEFDEENNAQTVVVERGE